MKIFYPLIITLIFSLHAYSQDRPTPSSDLEATTRIIKFYPNPATSIINFDFQKSYDQGYSIQVFNAVLGRKMYDQVNMPERTSINLSDFPRGLYIYQLRDRSGRMVESGKFQVAK